MKGAFGIPLGLFSSAAVASIAYQISLGDEIALLGLVWTPFSVAAFQAMSRLLVKNLPVYITPERLRVYFNQPSGPGGTITDVKVALKSDGTCRRFGFVGYKNNKEAQAAKEWFDKTFMDSARIQVNVIEVF
jgi:hypothetical protein